MFCCLFVRSFVALPGLGSRWVGVSREVEVENKRDPVTVMGRVLPQGFNHSMPSGKSLVVLELVICHLGCSIMGSKFVLSYVH